MTTPRFPLSESEIQAELERIAGFLNTEKRRAEEEEDEDPVAAHARDVMGRQEGEAGNIVRDAFRLMLGEGRGPGLEPIPLFDTTDARNLVNEIVERSERSFRNRQGRTFSATERADVQAFVMKSFARGADEEVALPDFNTDIASTHSDFLSERIDDEEQSVRSAPDAPTREHQFRIALQELRNEGVIDQAQFDLIANPQQLRQSLAETPEQDISRLEIDAVQFVNQLAGNLDTIFERAIPETGANFRNSVQNLIQREQAADVRGEGLFPRFGVSAEQEERIAQQERLLFDRSGNPKSAKQIVEDFLALNPELDPKNAPRSSDQRKALDEAKDLLISEAEALSFRTQGDERTRQFAMGNFVQDALSDGGRFTELAQQVMERDRQFEQERSAAADDFSTLSGAREAVESLFDRAGIPDDAIRDERFGSLAQQAFQRGGIDEAFRQDILRSLPRFIQEQQNAAFMENARENLEAIFGPAQTGTPVLDEARERAFARLEGELSNQIQRNPFTDIGSFLDRRVLARAEPDQELLEGLQAGQGFPSSIREPMEFVSERRQRAPVGFGTLGTEDISVLQGDEFAAERFNPFAVPTAPGLPEAQTIFPQFRDIPDEDIRRDIFPFLEEESPAFAQFVFSRTDDIERAFTRAEKRARRDRLRGIRGSGGGGGRRSFTTDPETGERVFGEREPFGRDTSAEINIVTPEGEVTGTTFGVSPGQVGARRPLDFDQFFGEIQLPRLRQEFAMTPTGIAERQREERSRRLSALRGGGTIFRRRRR